MPLTLSCQAYLLNEGTKPKAKYLCFWNSNHVIEFSTRWVRSKREQTVFATDAVTGNDSISELLSTDGKVASFAESRFD